MYVVVLSMPVEMYGESRLRGLEAHRPTVRHIAGLRRARGMQRRLIIAQSMRKVLVLRPTQLE